MILVIDNYDSFTYNLVDLIERFENIAIYKPDEVPLDLNVQGVVISPGPGHPDDTDDLKNIIHAYHHLPILGICLGAQALTTYYGGKVIVGKEVKHGKVDKIKVLEENALLYKACNHEFKIMRYHSLISDQHSFPSCLKITGKTKDAIQSFEHTKYPHFGIQYHPESFASEYGTEIIQAFIKICQEGVNHEHIKKTYTI